MTHPQNHLVANLMDLDTIQWDKGKFGAILFSPAK